MSTPSLGVKGLTLIIHGYDDYPDGVELWGLTPDLALRLADELRRNALTELGLDNILDDLSDLSACTDVNRDGRA